MQTQTGALIDVSVNASLVYDENNNPLLMRCVVRDITEKKRRRKNNTEGDTPMVESDCVRKIEQKNVCHEYYIMDLHRLQKCFAINRGYILMYIKKDFPLVLEIKVGTLGVLRAVLMYRQDGFDEEKE